MDLHDIKARMTVLGIRQADIANHLGILPQKVSLSLSGKRRFTVPEMDKLRELLGEHPSARAIPIIGPVAAGNWREAVQRASHSMPSPDPSIPAKAFGLKVEGDSMDLLVEDGGTVIVDPEDKQLFPKRYYVILNGEGETTFKRFEADPARLVPCSSNPEHKEIILGSGEGFVVIGRVIWRASRM